MDRTALKQQVKEWKAGYDAFNQYEVEQRRAETFADRLRAFTNILQFGESIPARPRPLFDEAIQKRWAKIRGGDG